MYTIYVFFTVYIYIYTTHICMYIYYTYISLDNILHIYYISICIYKHIACVYIYAYVSEILFHRDYI